MKLTQNDLKSRKLAYGVSIVSFAALYALYCFVLLPLTRMLEGNVMFANSFLVTVLSFAGRIAELLAMSVSFAVIFVCCFRYGAKNARGASLIFLLAAFCKYTANMAVDWGFSGAVSQDWLWDVINVLFFTALEAILLAVVLAVGKHAMRRASDAVYPFRGLYDKTNALMRAALGCAVTVMASKVAGQIVNDFYYIVTGGFPKLLSTWLLMAAAYLSYVIFGILCYFAVVFTMIKVLEHSEKNV